MKWVLDACVLFPPILRELLIGAASEGLYDPQWSDRILQEWVHATARLGPVAQMQAQGEAARLRALFPKAMVPAAPGIEARLMLPDANDVHVLATAIAGSAAGILTLNARDFPRHALAFEGVLRRDPDGFLWELHSHHPRVMERVAETVRARAEALSGAPVVLTALLKRARLNRLARAFQAG
jgi:predicted nucleic acid-binding protein